MSRFVIPQDRHRPRDVSNDLAFEVAFQAAQSDALQVGIAFKGFPLSIVNEPQGLPPLLSDGFASWGSPSPMRIEFASEAPTLSRWPSSPSGWDSPRGVPPPLYSEWDSLQGGPLLFLQVNEIHLKGLPLSTANGIRFRGVSSKANGIRLLGVPPYPGGFPSPSE